MQRLIQRCVLGRVLALAGLTILAACSTDIGSINIIPKTDLRPDWLKRRSRPAPESGPGLGANRTRGLP